MPEEIKLSVNFEFNKKYEGCVCLLYDKSVDKKVRRLIGGFHSIQGTMSFPKGSFSLAKPKKRGTYFKWYWYEDKVENFIWGDNNSVYPYQLGLVNFNNHVAFIQRYPNRQWSVGAHRNNTNLTMPAVPLISNFVRPRKVYPSDCPFTKYIEDFGYPPFPSFSQALTEIKGKQAYSRAFSNRYWVSVSSKHPNFIVGYKRWPIGTVEGHTIQLVPAAQNLEEDLSQFAQVEING